VSSISGSPQILSEFAAEADLAGPLSNAGWQRAAAAVVIATLIAAASATIFFFYLTASTGEIGLPALPVRPTWSAIQAPLPEIEMIAPERAGAPALQAAHDGSYAIQVASLESRSRADRLVAELVSAGFRARAVEFNLGYPRGVVLQVRVDGYSSSDVAARDLARIRELPGYGDAHLLSN
jgi:cell division septation protein DedD